MGQSRGFLLAKVGEVGRNKVVKRKYRTDPQVYGGIFPVMCLAHMGDSISETFRERRLPGFSDWEVRFKDVALTRKQVPGGFKWESGAEVAEVNCEAAYAVFLEGLEDNPRQLPNGHTLERVDVLDVDNGDRDRLGNAFLDLNAADDQLLWTLTARVRLVYAG